MRVTVVVAGSCERMPELSDGEWVVVDRRGGTRPGAVAVVTRAHGTVARWAAGIAASRAQTLILADGEPPDARAVAAHLEALVDPRVGARLAPGSWSVRRTALDEIRSLDRGFGGRGWFGPADVAARLARRGWAVCIDGRAVAAPTTAGEWEQWAWNAARYARKHRRRRVVRAAVRAGWALAAAGRSDAFPALFDAIVGGVLGSSPPPVAGGPGRPDAETDPAV